MYTQHIISENKFGSVSLSTNFQLFVHSNQHMKIGNFCRRGAIGKNQGDQKLQSHQSHQTYNETGSFSFFHRRFSYSNSEPVSMTFEELRQNAETA